MTWRTVAPLLSYGDFTLSLDGHLPLDLARGVVIDRMTEAARTESVISAIGWAQREGLKFTHFALQATGEGDDHDDEGRPRAIRGSTRLTTAFHALWIAKPANVHHELLIQFNGDESPSCDIVDRQTPFREHANNQLTPLDVAEAARLHEAILSLPRDGTLWLSLALMNVARQDQHTEIKYLMTWIAIEALFGSKRWIGDVKGPLNRRIGHFLGDPPLLRKGRVIRLYDLRSDVAHGLRDINYELLLAALFDSQEIVRLALGRILAEDNLRRVFDGDARDAFFDWLNVRPSAAR